MKNEYKKHIRAIAPDALIITCLFILTIVVWCISVFYFVNPIQKELATLETQTYTQVIESSDNTYNFHKLSKMQNLITFEGSAGSRHNLNCYIQASEFNLLSKQLSSGEAVISQKAASTLNVTIGDEITAYIPAYDYPLHFEIVSILPYGSDLYNVLENTDFSYIIIGNDQSISEKILCKTVYFLSADEYLTYKENTFSYSNVYNILEECDRIQGRLSIMYIFFIALVLVDICIFAVVFHNLLVSEIVKYYYDGFPIASVKRFLVTDHIVFWGIPCVLFVSWLLYQAARAATNSFFFLFPALIFVVVFGFTLILGGRKFGKVH